MVAEIGTTRWTSVSTSTRFTNESPGTTISSFWPRLRSRSASSKISRMPELSRYSVAERSSTSPDAVLGSAARRRARTDSAFERSTSPESRARTPRPSGSRLSSSSVVIRSPVEPSHHAHLGALLVAGGDADRVHHRLDEAQPTPAVRPARLAPAAEVAHHDRDSVAREGG